jgi:hypothetical protein
MFEKYKNKKLSQKEELIAGLLTLQQEEAKAIDAKIAEAEGVTDAAEKILKLQKLQQDIRTADWKVDNEQSRIVKQKSSKSFIKGSSAGVTGGLAAVAAGAFLITPPIAVFTGLGLLGFYAGAPFEKKTKKSLNAFIAEQSGPETFSKRMSDKAEAVRAMLDETVANCDLDKVAQSPSFSKAFKSCEPLADRFGAAAAARAALGDRTPERPKASANDTPKKPSKSDYDHLHI